MDKMWKKKWVKALRSGKYEQCTGRLHLKGDGYCCLGVLCDIVGAGRWENKPQINHVEEKMVAGKKEMHYVGDGSNA